MINETQMENNIESPTISNNDAEILPHDIDQPADWKKKITNVREERFIKIEDALIDLQTQQFSSKNENALDNVQNPKRDLVFDILKKTISDLEIKRKNVVIDYLNSRLSLKATDNSISSSGTRNFKWHIKSRFCWRLAIRDFLLKHSYGIRA